MMPDILLSPEEHEGIMSALSVWGRERARNMRAEADREYARVKAHYARTNNWNFLRAGHAMCMTTRAMLYDHGARIAETTGDHTLLQGLRDAGEPLCP